MIKLIFISRCKGTHIYFFSQIFSIVFADTMHKHATGVHKKSVSVIIRKPECYRKDGRAPANASGRFPGRCILPKKYFPSYLCSSEKYTYLCTRFQERNHGKMAEWSIAAVLKTVEPRGSRGSNPCLSAELTGQKWSVNGQKATNQ